MNHLIRRRLNVMSVVIGISWMIGVLPTRAQSPDILAFTGAGELTWTNGLTNLYYEVQWAPALNGSSNWHSGYDSLVAVQSSSNTITVPVPMFFRIAASSNRTHFAAPVPKTGQVISYRAGDDGDLEAGVAWPEPRFTVLSDTNGVLDNLTGLIWARNANLMGSKTNWNAAIDFCNALELGGMSDWRLPNKGEMMSLLDHSGQTNGPLAIGHPFGGIMTDFYWTSTTYVDDTNNAFVVYFWPVKAGLVSRSDKDASYYPLWPVRGGQ